jgi:hypothetical protein
VTVAVGDPAERSRICEHVLGELPGWFGLRDAENPCPILVKRL